MILLRLGYWPKRFPLVACRSKILLFDIIQKSSKIWGAPNFHHTHRMKLYSTREKNVIGI